MANAKPYMTSDDLVNSVKLRMAFPIDQSTFNYNQILLLANEEMMINAVPQIIQEHEEYFTYKMIIPLVQNVSRYTIPNRTLGMALRDVMWSDNQGNFGDMVRISPEDRGYFQNNSGLNQGLSKYYLEGNQIVLTPNSMLNPTGNLNFWIYLRPNQLVNNDRAATIVAFQKKITILSNSSINPGDTIDVETGIQTPDPTTTTFFAINSSAQTIVSNAISTNGLSSTITTTNAHNIPVNTNFQVIITGVTGSTPTINGTFSATSLSANTFSVPVVTTVAGTGGSYTIENQFVIGATDIITSSNLSTTLGLAGFTDTLNLADNTISYDDITTTFTISNELGFSVDNDNLYIEFDQLPVTYTDPDSQEVSDLYTVGCLVDFLQTLPGHRTYTFDITLQNIVGTVGVFSVSELQTYQMNGSGGTMEYFPILVGDYICLQNECIIPGIPPELHSALAERTASRIMMAIGDRDGYAVSQQKIAEMDRKQANLIGSRVEGSVPKVFNRYNLLRMGKRTVRRRFF